MSELECRVLSGDDGLMTLRPEIYLYPYFRISEPVSCGAWNLNLRETKRLRRNTNPKSNGIARVIERHLDPKGKVLHSAVVATRTGPGWDDVEARRTEVDAFHSAVSFAVLNANADDRYRIPWDSGLFEPATSETAIISVTPEDAVHGDASLLRRGPINSHLVGGATGHLKLPAPEGLISIPILTLDARLLEATFRNAMAATTPESSDANKVEREIYAAIHWYSRAWENSPLHTMPDVIVQLKTSLEALSGRDKTKDSVKVLGELYAAAVAAPGGEALLWQNEGTRFERTDRNGKTYDVTTFEHWFWNFAETRNKIVHDTLDPEMEYVMEGSPFAGNIFRVADRVCRELIRINLSRLERDNLLMSESALQIQAVFKEIGGIEQQSEDH